MAVEQTKQQTLRYENVSDEEKQGALRVYQANLEKKFLLTPTTPATIVLAERETILFQKKMQLTEKNLVWHKPVEVVQQGNALCVIYSSVYVPVENTTTLTKEEVDKLGLNTYHSEHDTRNARNTNKYLRHSR